MRAPDRDLPAVAKELLRSVTAGRKPQLTAGELDLLEAYIRKQRPDRRGHSKKRWIEGVNRRTLRDSMEWLKSMMRHDPAELELKRTMRANRETYVLNRRVAEYMRKQLSEKNSGKKIPSVKALENILNRSTANEPDVDPLWC